MDAGEVTPADPAPLMRTILASHVVTSVAFLHQKAAFWALPYIAGLLPDVELAFKVFLAAKLGVQDVPALGTNGSVAGRTLLGFAALQVHNVFAAYVRAPAAIGAVDDCKVFSEFLVL